MANAAGLHFDGGNPEIPPAAGRILKGKVVKGNIGDGAVIVAGVVAALVIDRLAAAMPAAEGGAKIPVDQVPAIHHLDDITDDAVGEMGSMKGVVKENLRGLHDTTS